MISDRGIKYLAFSNNNVFGPRICPISSGAAFVPILLREVEAIVVGAALCDGEAERSYTVYDPLLDEKYPKYFKRY